jgi:hypothetical protein
MLPRAIFPIGRAPVCFRMMARDHSRRLPEGFRDREQVYRQESLPLVHLSQRLATR